MFTKAIIAATLVAAASAGTVKPSNPEVYWLTDCYTDAITGNYSAGDYYCHFGTTGNPEAMGPIIGGSLHSLQKWDSGKEIRLAMGNVASNAEDAPGSGVFDVTINKDACRLRSGQLAGHGRSERADRKGVTYSCYRGDDKVLYVQDGAKCKGTYYCLPTKKH